MEALTETELKSFLVENSDWNLEEGRLVREWKFADFVEAMHFVNRLPELAEAQGHHPDIDIRYNKVLLGLVTHDANGISRRDVKLATDLNRL